MYFTCKDTLCKHHLSCVSCERLEVASVVTSCHGGVLAAHIIHQKVFIALPQEDVEIQNYHSRSEKYSPPWK